VVQQLFEVIAMFATLLTQKDSDSKSRSFDDWFESFTPAKTAGSTRAAEQVQKRVRHQIIEEWMAQLPAHVRPLELAAQFESVLLNLIGRWDNHSAVLIYLDELVVTDRLDERWVSPQVFAEVARLSRFVRQTRQARALV
jgi:hypothetical protein